MSTKYAKKCSKWENIGNQNWKTLQNEQIQINF